MPASHFLPAPEETDEGITGFVPDCSLAFEDAFAELPGVGEFLLLENSMAMIFIIAESSLVSQPLCFVDLFASSMSLVVPPLSGVRLQTVIESAGSMRDSIADGSLIVRILSNESSVSTHVIIFPSAIIEGSISGEDEDTLSTSHTIFVGTVIRAQGVSKGSLIALAFLSNVGQHW